jgi:hypothetical protein
MLLLTPTLMTLALVKGVCLGIVAGVALSRACRCRARAAKPEG